MSDVHIVLASFDREASPPIGAFADHEEAAKFADQCRAHTRSEPPYPMTDMSDAEFDRQEEACLAHRRMHPAGYLNAQADDFLVVTLPLTA